MAGVRVLANLDFSMEGAMSRRLKLVLAVGLLLSGGRLHMEQGRGIE